MPSLTRYLGLRRVSPPQTPDHTGDYGMRVRAMHGSDAPSAPLRAAELRQVTACALFGATGTILILIGSLGTGEQPVTQNPIAGMRVLSLPARMWSTALTLTLTGLLMLVLAWLLLGRFAVGRAGSDESDSTPRRLTTRQVRHIFALWAIPFCLMPPFLSTDAYSYLAQSKIAYLGLDPYKVGPSQGLGLNDVFTRSVPTIWRDTPTPYGPVFLELGQLITRITGENVVVAVLLHRALAMVGVLLILWALPRMAQRTGVNPSSALWLGGLNPLLMLHLIGGLHNDALMLGLMLVGLELSLRAIEGSRSPGYGEPVPASPPLWHNHRPSRAGWLLLLGVGLVCLGAMVKVTAVATLAFIGVALARRWGARLPALRDASPRQWWGRSKASIWALVKAAALLGSILAVITVATCSGSGLGYGWVGTVDTANVVRTWMSGVTDIALGASGIGHLLGLGYHTQTVIDLARPVGQLIACVIICRWLLAQLAGRLNTVGAFGIAMVTLVLLFPFVQPWYLLWAILPLAAWITERRARFATIAVSAAVSVIVLPQGAPVGVPQMVQGWVSAVIVTAVLSFIFFETRPGAWLRNRIAGGRRITSRT